MEKPLPQEECKKLQERKNPGKETSDRYLDPSTRPNAPIFWELPAVSWVFWGCTQLINKNTVGYIAGDDSWFLS